MKVRLCSSFSTIQCLRKLFNGEVVVVIQHSRGTLHLWKLQYRVTDIECNGKIRFAHLLGKLLGGNFAKVVKSILHCQPNRNATYPAKRVVVLRHLMPSHMKASEGLLRHIKRPISIAQNAVRDGCYR